ncbi:hypothetical protein VKT23_015124 [Stygiomarasmius scandens]|uniref:C2H2-type domain-containing protein n=1 Tax=Marasmiellus scandens TaxID=2682957 RepID=A0ABR1IYZ1_9AGAR
MKMFEVNGFQEDSVERNFQSDNSNVFTNTDVTIGLHFDSSGCLMATRQRHNSDPSASANPRDVSPHNVPHVFTTSNTVLAPNVLCEEPTSAIAPVKRKATHFPKHREGVSQTTEYRHLAAGFVQLGSYKKSRLRNQEAKRTSPVQNTLPCHVTVSSPGTNPLNPKTRASPESEQTGSSPVNSFTAKHRFGFSRDSVRFFPVSSDRNQTSTSSDSNDSGTFLCYSRYCQQLFKSLDDVKEHFRAEHLSCTNQLRCAYMDCSKTTNTLGDMSRHEFTLAHKEPSFHCHSPNCGKSFTREDALKRHWNSLSGHEVHSRRAGILT